MTSEFGQVPAICREVGLTCKRCTEDSARSLAGACKGLQGKAITQLFRQIYPVGACAPMSGHFVRSYKAAAAQTQAITPVPVAPLPAAKPLFEKREVRYPRRRAYAVAS